MLRRLIQPVASAVSGAARIALGRTHAMAVRGRSGSAVGRAACTPAVFRVHCDVGGRCAARALSLRSLPTAPTHFVQALTATASTRRFGLQPSFSAVVTLPAGLSVRLRRAHDVWEVVEVPPPLFCTSPP